MTGECGIGYVVDADADAGAGANVFLKL